MSGYLELLVFGLLVAVAGLVMLSSVLRVPYRFYSSSEGSSWVSYPSCPMSSYRRIWSC
jgi:hypothetical protein